MKELFGEKPLWAVTAVCFLAVAAGIPFLNLELPLAAGSFIKFYEKSLHSRTVLFLVPIVSVLPAGAMYVREASGGFLKLYIARISRMEYVKRKTFLVYAGGFLPFFLAGAAAFFLAFFLLYPMEVKGGADWESVVEVLLCLLRICLAGGIVAEISGIFSALFCNYYMAYGLPFVCYYLLVILKDRYFQGMYALDPAEWILAEQNWGTDGHGIWIFFLVFSAAAMLLHGLLLYVRLKRI